MFAIWGKAVLHRLGREETPELIEALADALYDAHLEYSIASALDAAPGPQLSKLTKTLSTTRRLQTLLKDPDLEGRLAPSFPAGGGGSHLEKLPPRSDGKSRSIQREDPPSWDGLAAGLNLLCQVAEAHSKRLDTHAAFSGSQALETLIGECLVRIARDLLGIDADTLVNSVPPRGDIVVFADEALMQMGVPHTLNTVATYIRARREVPR